MSKLSEILAAAKAKIAAEKEAKNTAANAIIATAVKQTMPEAAEIQSADSIHYGIDRYGNSIEWNADQWKFIQLVSQEFKSAVLIGAAGTGKTTTMRGAIESLIQNRFYPPMNDEHKHLPESTPGIVCISYTRRAVMNLRKALPEDLKSNCITIHKLLEYQPVFYEIFDELAGEWKKTMRFEPGRNAMNHLSENIKTIIIDESSMVSVDLFHKVWTALPNPSAVQFIFLGDIQQLPPIFGSAILGFKMLSLPLVELTIVYRQALESPIIRFAHRILSGIPVPESEFPQWKFPNQLTLHPWKKRISSDSAILTIAAFFKKAYDAGQYDSAEDMILIPFNKACGTDELNKHIGNHIARKKGLITYEVIAGFVKHYFSVGEKVLFEKEDAEIIEIRRNPTYAGKWPQPPSTRLDYWGTVQESESKESEHHITEKEPSESESEQDIDALLAGIAANVGDDERVKEASHIITVELLDSERTVELKSAAEINALIMAYALTVHKSQGSEWRKVFLILHQSHNTMIQRELLYTAVTRAREELYVICEPNHFEQGITGQRIKGNTLQEKASFFQGKLDNGENDLVALMNNSQE